MSISMPLVLACCIGLALPAFAADEIRTVPVSFAKGRTSAVVKGKVKGYDTVDYTLAASAGQKLDVALKSANRSMHFNVLAPGEDLALFVGPTSGHHFAGTLHASGDYVVRAYLMSDAARRNETAAYSITFKLVRAGGAPAR
jgi:hypothetical protein